QAAVEQPGVGNAALRGLRWSDAHGVTSATSPRSSYRKRAGSVKGAARRRRFCGQYGKMNVRGKIVKRWQLATTDTKGDLHGDAEQRVRQSFRVRDRARPGRHLPA